MCIHVYMDTYTYTYMCSFVCPYMCPMLSMCPLGESMRTDPLLLAEGILKEAL